MESKSKNGIKAIIKNFLNDGPKRINEIEAEAKKYGIASNTIRGILYKWDGDEVVNIVGTLWTLKENRTKLTEEIIDEMIEATKKFKKLKRNDKGHREAQSILLKLGKESGYKTYIPSQDKEYKFNEYEKLVDIVDIYILPSNEKKENLRTIDVIWYNDIDEVQYVFEIENKDIRKIEAKLKNYLQIVDSVSKKMYIVSNLEKEKIENIMRKNAKYDLLKNKIEYLEINSLIGFYNQWCRIKENKAFNISKIIIE